MIGTIGSPVVSRDVLAKYIPNIHTVTDTDEFKAYRERKGDDVEITVYYTEPGREKTRVDFTFDARTEPHPPSVRVTYWGPAATAILGVK